MGHGCYGRGDFNCSPEQLGKTGWLKLVQGRILSPRFSTCGSRVLDFFVVSEGLAGAAVGVSVVEDALCSGGHGSHKPVRLFLRANPRQMKVRTLKTCTTIEAKLPYGPERRWVYDETEQENLDGHGLL